MTSISSVSQTELAQRRQQLRHERRMRTLQTSWRTLAVSGIAGGLAWVITLPGWVIRQPDQVAIAGNQFLSKPAIQSLLPLSYPQSLLEIEPQVLADRLKAQTPIAEATVTRQLFPPRLIVQVKERRPIAMTVPAAEPINLRDSVNQATAKTPQDGFLDADGVWIPLASYTAFDRSFKLPTLKVIGLTEQSRSHWPQLYQELSHSPVKVLQIDWRDPNNLILKTELGIFHFGSYGSKFAEQLKAIDRLRKLPEKLNSNQIVYIDLRNPDAPAIQMKKAAPTVKSNTSAED
jgi:cell division protein FtsQ